LDLSDWSTIYIISSFTAGIVSVLIAIYLAPYWKNISARILLLLMIAVAIWSLAYGMECISPNMEMKLWWVHAQYLGVVWIGILILSFVLLVTKQKYKIKKTGYMLLCIIPVLIIILAFTNDSHHLMWSSAWLDLSIETPVLSFERGPCFWLLIAYSYTSIALATIILIKSFVISKGILRKQLFTVLIGVLVPWLSNITNMFGSPALKLLDLTPIAFAISGMAFSWGLLKYQMLSLIPLAREAVIDSMNDPIVALDIDDRVLDINKAAETIFRINDFTPAHHKLKDLIPILHDQVVKHRKPNQPEIEASFKVEKIQQHWNLRITTILNKRGKQTGWMVILRDITERKNAETALKESETIHRAMLEASPNPIVYYNETGEVTYINPAFTRVFGWDISELFGKRTDFVPKENWPETKKALEKTLENPEGNYDFITRRYTKTGDILDVSINSALFRAKDGNSTNMIVNFTDITKIKKTEHELRNSKNFIRSIIDSMPSVLIGVNAEGIITQWNIEAEHLTKISADAAEESLLKDVFPHLAKHISNVEQIIKEQKAKKETKVTLKFKDKIILTDITIYPIQSDTIQGAVIRVDDISDRVRIEELMVQSEKMMSVGGLAAGMAHEINNPLAGILQNIQVIHNRLSKNLPINIETAEECGVNLEDIKSYMEKRNILPMMELVRSSGEQAAKIVSNMLSFSRKSHHRKSTHYLHEIMDDTIGLVHNDYSMKKKYDFRSIEIKKEYQKNIPPIPCEKNEIQQVLLNIIKNGTEAMAEARTDSPKFILRHLRKDNMVIFEIEDNGPGIDTKTKSRIFEPFFTTKDVGVGTGLGLSVSYFIIVENHNGDLSVESSVGHGTTFKIALPTRQTKNNL
jgi:PAS domain S-box-containing protein